MLAGEPPITHSEEEAAGQLRSVRGQHLALGLDFGNLALEEQKANPKKFFPPPTQAVRIFSSIQVHGTC